MTEIVFEVTVAGTLPPQAQSAALQRALQALLDKASLAALAVLAGTELAPDEDPPATPTGEPE